MTPRQIFEAYNGLDCQDYLYSLRTECFKAACDSEPSVSSWNMYEYDDGEYTEDDLPIVKEYMSAFETMQNEAEKLIGDLCYEVTVSLDLYHLLEDVFFDYISTEDYRCFHLLFERYEKGHYEKEELENLYRLAKDDKGTFIALITPLKTKQ